MNIIGRLEQKARSCYADPIDVNNQDFVKILLLHGCFLLEFNYMDSTVCNKRFLGQGGEPLWIDHDKLFCGLMYDFIPNLTMFENHFLSLF